MRPLDARGVAAILDFEIDSPPDAMRALCSMNPCSP